MRRAQHAVGHRNNERGTSARALSDSSSAQTYKRRSTAVRAAAGGRGRTEQLVGCAVRPCDLQSLRQPRRRVVRSTVRETRRRFPQPRRSCMPRASQACMPRGQGGTLSDDVERVRNSEVDVQHRTGPGRTPHRYKHALQDRIRPLIHPIPFRSVPSRPVSPMRACVRACTFMCGCMCCMRGHSVRGGVCARAPASGLTRARACANTYAYVVSASAPAAFRALLARRAAVAGCAVSSRRGTVALPTLQSALTRADTP